MNPCLKTIKVKFFPQPKLSLSSPLPLLLKRARATFEAYPQRARIDFNLETRNFENLVNFYASKLIRVLAGEKVSDVFTGTERSKLVLVGVLEYGKSRKDIIVSLKTQEILNQLQ